MHTFLMSKARYKQWVDQYAADIRSGKLAPSTKLPTHRELAARHQMSLVTATRVYAELEQMGLVTGEVGRGTYVREIGLPPSIGAEQHAAADMIDLNFNYPALPSQAELLRDALKQLAVSGDLDALLRYQLHAGRLHERQLVASYLKQQSINVQASNIVFTNGAQHGLSTILMSLFKPGDVIAVDALTYPGFRLLAQVCHLELVAIPANEQGTDLAALERICQKRRVKAMYCMPTLHNPMGWVMPQAQRLKLIKLARHYDFLILEDATYAFLVENPPPALISQAPDITLYISGFSKSVASGLRFGFVVAGSQWISNLERTIRVTTWNTPTLLTAITCGWLENGIVAKLEHEKRQDAALRQKLAQQVLAPLGYFSHPNSYFLWLPLPEEVRTETLVMDLMRKGISVASAEHYACTSHTPRAIRIALGSIPLEQLKAALIQVKQMVELHASY